MGQQGTIGRCPAAKKGVQLIGTGLVSHSTIHSNTLSAPLRYVNRVDSADKGTSQPRQTLLTTRQRA